MSLLRSSWRLVVALACLAVLPCLAGAQRSWNMTPAGRIGGSTRLVDYHGSRLLVGSGAQLRMYDVATPNSPVLLDSYTFSSNIQAIVANGTTGFVLIASEGRSVPVLVVFDLHGGGGTHLAVVGQLTTDSFLYGWDLALEGNLLCLIRSEGLTTIDVSDPAHPTMLATDTNAAYCYRVALSDGYAYLMTGSNDLIIEDVRTPASPSTVALFSLKPDDYITDVAAANHVAYLSLYSQRLAVLDVADPAHPALVRTLTNAGGANRPCIDNGRLFLAVGYQHLASYSLAAPTNPALLGELAMNSDISDLGVSGAYGYTAANLLGLKGIDFTSAATPVVDFTMDYPLPYVAQVKVAGGVAVAARGFRGMSVLTGSGGAWQEAGSLELPGIPERVALQGQRAYIFGYVSPIPIVDISIPTAPVVVGSIPYPEDARRGEISGNLLAVGGASNVVRFFDISGPSPVVAGTVTLDAGASTRSLSFSPDGHLWVAAGPAGLYEITTSPAPAVARHHPVANAEALDVVVQSGRAYLARGAMGLEVLDVTGPTITKIDHAAESAGSVALAADGSLYVGEWSYDGIVDHFDTGSDRLRRLGYFQAPSPPITLASTPDALWMACAQDGLALAAPFADPAPNHPPNRPWGLSPSDGATDIELTPVLTLTDFSDPDDPGTPAGRSSGATFLVVDSNGAGVATGYSGGSTFTVGAGLLQPNTVYYWYGAYGDQGGDYLTYGSMRSGWNRFTTGDGTPFVNTPPVAEAGPVITAVPGQTVLLDARGSSDAEHDPLGYSWYETSGPVVTLSDRYTAVASFVAPAVPSITTFTFGVQVSDGRASRTDTTTVTVDPGDHAPAVPLVVRPTPGQAILAASDLVVSAFSDPDAGDSCQALRWQIAADADTTFNAPVVDEVLACATSRVVPAGLIPDTPYRLRVAHQDSHGVFGAYSTAVTFQVRTYVPEAGWTVR